MKSIAIIGARGVGNYGGFETYVRDILPYLSKNFNEVHISTEFGCGDVKGIPKNVILKEFPLRMSENILVRYFVEFFIDIYFGIYYCLKKRVDVCYYLGPSIGLFSVINRAMGQKVAINMAGLEWKRDKFSAIEKALLYLQFWMSQISCNYFIVDNEGLIEFVDKRNHWKTHFLPYGVNEPETHGSEAVLSKFGLESDEYILSIVRLQPDNNIVQAIEMYGLSATTMPYMIVGGLSSKKDFLTEIENAISKLPQTKKVIMPGGIYDQNALNVLRKNCHIYIHPHSIGGTNPSLLEAMICKCVILANDTKFNRNVGGDTFIYYLGQEQGKGRIDSLVADSLTVSKMRDSTYIRVKEEFNYDKIGQNVVDLLTK